jgi:hypothetical protein
VGASHLSTIQRKDFSAAYMSFSFEASGHRARRSQL